MNFLTLAKIAQIVIGVFTIFFVLIQSKGVGLSSAVSGTIGHYRSRRGIEKVVFALTCVFGLLLIVNSVFIILLS